ncbi:MAG: beta-galactosidase [Lachnospiraceae bacterium]|nr:beta-galactosidase [Lachnospiraceae bacterium]
MKQITTWFVALGLILGVCFANVKTQAADTNGGLVQMKFDLGGKGTATGYIGVSATDKYDPKKGYGIGDTSLARNVDAPGRGALSDAIHFQGGDGNLAVDLPQGVYKITVTTGNVNKATINAEGINQLFFLQGNNAVDSFTIPVTDGQLNIYATSGVGSEFSISTIEIQQVSAKTTTKPTIWLAGDATVATYYNASANSKRGWGMYLSKYVDMASYDVRNISISGIKAESMKNTAFPTVEYYGKKGDILVLAVGINDYIEEYTDYVKNNDPIDPSKYIAHMTEVIRRAKAKGMTVYLVQQQGEEDDIYGYPFPEHKWFGKELEQLAKQEKVGYLDLFRPWLEFLEINRYYEQIDYYAEGLNPNAQGADLLAQMMAELLFPSPSQVDLGDPVYDFGTNPSVVYQTEASGKAISNPHKGFVMTAYTPYMLSSAFEYGIGGSKKNAAWDVVTIVSGSPKWCDLNPREGYYDWSSIDQMLEACAAQGMTYGIRIMPYSSYLEEDYVPQWVYTKGAKKNTEKLRDDTTKTVEFPKWDDPVYLQACKDFAVALAKKYDGDPRVEFIDIRPFGDYGEWHNSFAVGEFMPSLEIQKDMLDCYAAAFHKTTLALPSNARGAIYEYAISLGITKRDDGLISLGHSEWSLVPTYRANLPVIGENYWPYAWMRDTVRENEYSLVNWTQERFRETIEISHLSIYALDQDSNCSYEFYKEQKSTIDAMCNRLGYNFTVVNAARLNNKLAVTIKNTGLAPAYFDIYLCAEITDANGKKITNFGNPILIKNGTFEDGKQKTYVFDYNGTLPSDATICLAMYEASKYKSVSALTSSKDDPTVRFDNKNNLTNKRFKLVGTSAPTVSVRADKSSVTAGETLTITADASGAGTLKYQWQSRKNSSSAWTNSAQNGAKTAKLSVATSAGLNGWQFRCVVTDGSGYKSYSKTVTVNVTGVPKITTQPKNQTVAVGDTLTYTVMATGKATLKYQWQSRKNASSAWTNSGQSGAKTAALNVATIAGLHGWQFRCVVTDGSGQKAYSSTVTVSLVPKITKQPSAASVKAGTKVALSVAATGRATLKYQWQSRRNSSAEWTNSGQSGAKTATLTIATLAGLNGWQFRCVVTDGNGQKAYSNVVTLSVK